MFEKMGREPSRRIGGGWIPPNWKSLLISFIYIKNKFFFKKVFFQRRIWSLDAYLFKIGPDRDKMINNQWQEVIKESDHLSWNLLTNENTIENDAATDTDSDENIEEIGALKNKQTNKQNKKNHIQQLCIMLMV